MPLQAATETLTPKRLLLPLELPKKQSTSRATLEQQGQPLRQHMILSLSIKCVALDYFCAGCMLPPSGAWDSARAARMGVGDQREPATLRTADLGACGGQSSAPFTSCYRRFSCSQLPLKLRLELELELG